MSSKYQILSKRIGKKKACIAIGHKILIAAYHVLRDLEPYHSYKPDPKMLKIRRLRKIERLEREIKKLKKIS